MVRSWHLNHFLLCPLLTMSQVQLKINLTTSGNNNKKIPRSPLLVPWCEQRAPRPGPHAHNPRSLMRNPPEPWRGGGQWLEIPPTGASLWTVCAVRAVGFESLLYSVLENCTADFIILSQCPSKMHSERYSSAQPLCATRDRRWGKLGVQHH